MANDKDTNPNYWKEYNNLQHTKHALIEQYLGGWFPKLGSWSGRILYLDTHAGKGKHDSGKYGSPLIALKTLLEHSYKDTILKKCEVIFKFIELDEENCAFLKSEIEALGKLPKNIKTDVITGNCFEELEELVEYLKESGKNLAPAFIFVDPYGFKVPGDILKKLMEFPNVELFVNIIWRELSMAIAQAESKPGMAKTLDLVFDGNEWRSLIGQEFRVQADEAVKLLRTKFGANWATHIRMLGKNQAIRYLLLHLSNHDAGRDLMKYCMWKTCPGGDFYARSTDNPSQQFLIEDKPDLSSLKVWVTDKLKNSPKKWKSLLNDIRAEAWRDTHLNQAIRELRKEKIINGRKHDGVFAPKNNPELYLC